MLINGDSCTNFSSDMSLDNGNDSYFYDGAEPGHDFLAELSRDLDIPMLLDNDPLSHFLEEISPDDIISEVDGLNENTLDKTILQSETWQSDPFLNLMVPKSKNNIKNEFVNTDKIIDMDYDIDYIVKQEMNDFKNEPLSPQRNTPSPSDSNSSREYSSENNSVAGTVLNKSAYNNNLDTPPISPQASLTQITSEPCTIIPSGVISYNQGPIQLIRIQDNVKVIPTKRPPIQPKPTAKINHKNKNSLVLSPQQFAALAKSGKLQKKINDIKQDLAVMKTQKPILIKSETTVGDLKPNLEIKTKSEKVIDTKTSGLLSIGHELESRAIKKHQRMIKNRESACLSRKKKKEYVSSLEGKIAELTLENSQLKLENAQLKARLEASLNESSTATKIFNNFAKPPNMKKNTAFLLAMVVMVSFNVGTIGNMFMHSPKLSSLDNDMSDVPIGGRHLLWVDNENVDYPNLEVKNDLKTNITTTAAKFEHDKVKTLDQPICPMFINVSESLRLESELRRWIGAPETTNNQTQDQYKNIDLTLNLLNDYPKPRLFKRSINEVKNKKAKLRRRKITIPEKNYAKVGEDENKNELDVFQPNAQNFAKYLEFYEAINRRDDTFYVVSFNYDHLLLPALAHNNTLRPKMSLLMPILGANNSFSTDHVELMQIDCEVTDTSLVHLNYKSIPRHLRPNNVNNSTTNDPTEQPEVYAEQNIEQKMGKHKNDKYAYKPYFIQKSYQPNLLTERSNGTN